MFANIRQAVFVIAVICAIETILSAPAATVRQILLLVRQRVHFEYCWFDIPADSSPKLLLEQQLVALPEVE